MALSDELTELLARTGNGILSDAASFGAALDDFLTPEAASRGVTNLLVDAVRQGAFDRMQRDIAHGGDPHMAVAAAGDQLARDRAATDVAPSRWAVAVLGVAAGVLDRGVLDAQTAPAPSVPQPTPPSAPPSTPPSTPPPTPPPHAPPLAAPPVWGPPPSAARPRRRTGLVVGAVLLALALVGGGTTAAILIAQDDPSARRTDPSTDAPTTDGPTSDGATTDGPVVADPFVIADLMKEVALDSFPGAVDPQVTARSWSTAADNLDGGFPRDLAVGERASATAWSVSTTIDVRRLDIRAEHEPSDGGSYYDWKCEDFESSGDVLAECTEVLTSDGRTAIEYWYINPTLTSASHNLVVPGDHATGRLEVFVGERLSEPPSGLTIAGLEEKLQLSSRAMLDIAEDPRLRLPLPSPLPPLPSYGFCFDADPRPAECPANLD